MNTYYDDAITWGDWLLMLIILACILGAGIVSGH